MLRVSQVGGRGGGPLLGTAAQICFFLNEPSLTLFWGICKMIEKVIKRVIRI